MTSDQSAQSYDLMAFEKEVLELANSVTSVQSENISTAEAEIEANTESAHLMRDQLPEGFEY